jgi:MFS family permease
MRNHGEPDPEGGGGSRPPQRSRRAFFHVMFAQTLSLVGDQLLAIALPLWVYDQTGSASATAATALARVLPIALLSAIGGAIVDRSRRRRLLVVTTVARGIAAAPLLIVAWGSVPFPVLLGVVALLACLGQVNGPAVGASLPVVVAPDDLPRANAQLAARTVLVQLSAPAAGAFIYESQGLATVVVVNMALYLVATCAWAILPLDVPSPASRNRLLYDTVEGLRRVRRDPKLTRLLVAASLALIGLAIEMAVLVPFVRDELGAPARAVGWLTTAQAVGGLIASALLPWLHRKRGLDFLLRLGMLGVPAATIGLLVSRDVVQALPGLVAAGMLLTVLGAGMQLHVQTTVEGGYLGRVIGVVFTAVGAASVLGAALALVLTSVIPLRACLLIAAGIEVAGVLYYWVGERRSHPT